MTYQRHDLVFACIALKQTRGQAHGREQKHRGQGCQVIAGLGGWKEEMKNNLMAFVFITIWIAMGIPLIYFARMFFR